MALGDRIYQYQTALSLRFNTMTSLSNVSTVTIKYIKPSASTASTFTGSTHSTTGWVKYDISSTGDLDEAGAWIFWPYITFTDTTVMPCNPIEVTVYAEGTL